ncbi:putative repeat protein (TIGR01451 family) [Actinoplanes tereljensis]|uniref:DUF11 domain-containing protein n=1 Tax=Paractinoplanes tereljensis TaxID=571912 RepID=A0A919NJT3_9ACTN|nr:CARDB domain-containing protein [Actinoplanes tereljensis]GIF20019.1 hypothetical protein Ate02nite_27490 [Actinoplanes tereljensis]
MSYRSTSQRRLPLTVVLALLGGMITVVLPATPAAAAVTRTLAYFATTDSGLGNPKLTVINTADNSVVDRIPLSSAATGIAIAPDGKTAYVPLGGSNSVSKVDLTTDKVVKSIAVGANPRRPAFADSGRKLYVPNLNGNSVSVIDTTNDTVVKTINIGTGADGAWTGPDGNVYLPSRSTGTLKVIDPDGDTVRSLTVGTPGTIAFSPNGSRAYVTGLGDIRVHVINTADLTVADSIVVNEGPQTLSITPDGSRLYVGHSVNGTTEIVTADKSTSTIPSVPFWDSAMMADGKHVYFASSGNGAHVLDTENGTFQNVALGAGERSLYVAIGTVTTSLADMGVTISDNGNPGGPTNSVEADTPMTYQAVVTNRGPDAAGAKLTVALSSIATLQGATSDNGTCTVSGRTATCTLDTLANGGTATVEVKATPTSAGILTATATVDSDVVDSVEANDVRTDTTSITPRPPTSDVEVTTTGPVGSVQAGTAYSFGIAVKNTGPDNATNVKATVVLSGGAHAIQEVSSNRGSCSFANSTVTCNLGTFTTVTAGNITVTAKSDAAGSVTATSTVEATQLDKTPANNTSAATATITPAPAADLVVTTSDTPDPVEVGSNVVYTAAVKNNGPVVATGVKVAVAMSGADSAILSGSGGTGPCFLDGSTITCTISSIAAGATANVTVTVKSQAPGTLSAKATATGEQPDPTPANSTATETTTVNARPLSANLSVTTTGSADPVEVGTPYTYKAVVKNNGPDDATGVKATVVLTGAAHTIQSATVGGDDCAINASTVTCTIGALANDASTEVIVTVKPEAAGTINAAAKAEATQADPTPANNTSTESTTITAVPSADLSVTSTGSADPVQVGTPYTYTAVVKNDGPSAATAVKATVVLTGANHQIQSAGSCPITGSTVTCTIGALASGASTTITVTVKPLAVGTISATTTVEAAQADPAPANNKATASTTIAAVQYADLSVTTTDSADPVPAGTPYFYRAAVKNNGPNAATDVKATIVLAGAAHTIEGAGSCTVNGSTLTCPVGSLASGASTTITVVVKADAAGTISATATVEAAQTDPVPANNKSVASTTISAPLSADLAVVTTDSPDPVALANTFQSTSTVTNRGPDMATAVTTTVTLTGSAALILTATSSLGTCTIAGSTATCVQGNLAKNATATITLVVEPQALGTITATAKVTGSLPDLVPANNTVVETTTVNNALGCTKIGTPGNDVLAGTTGNDVICLLGGDDSVNAFAGDDVVYGGSGNDTIQGDIGNDTLYGGLGNDTLAGGAGFDRIDGGPGTDTCTTGENVVNCP